VATPGQFPRVADPNTPQFSSGATNRGNEKNRNEEGLHSQGEQGWQKHQEPLIEE
jgi:hypothetical protein